MSAEVPDSMGIGRAHKHGRLTGARAAALALPHCALPHCGEHHCMRFTPGVRLGTRRGDGIDAHAGASIESTEIQAPSRVPIAHRM